MKTRDFSQYYRLCSERFNRVNCLTHFPHFYETLLNSYQTVTRRNFLYVLPYGSYRSLKTVF